MKKMKGVLALVLPLAIVACSSETKPAETAAPETPAPRLELEPRLRGHFVHGFLGTPHLNQINKETTSACPSQEKIWNASPTL